MSRIPSNFIVPLLTALAIGCGAKQSAPKTNAAAAPAVQPAVTESAVLAPIVIIRGRDHSITVFAASGGPRFTVATLDGAVIAAELSADEMQRQQPEIYERYRSSFAACAEGALDASLSPHGRSLGSYIDASSRIDAGR